MIEQNFELGHKPSLFDKFSNAGRLKIKEYNNTVAFQEAVAVLNTALEPHAQKIRNLKAGNPPQLLHRTNEEEYHKPDGSGSLQNATTISARRDANGIVSLRGDEKQDDFWASDYIGERGRRQSHYSHSIKNKVAIIDIDQDGHIKRVSLGSVRNAKSDLVSDIWSKKEFIAIPEAIEDRGKQAEAIRFLARLL